MESNSSEIKIDQNAQIVELVAALEVMKRNSDDFFLIINAIIIFLMQAGFAFLEAGMVKSKNVVHTLLINYAEAFFSALIYWLIGYGFAFGGSNPFIGLDHWALYNLPEDKFSFWFFQFAFAATTCTIVSGAVVERVEFLPYSAAMILTTGFIYPVVSHWAWDPVGWLAAGITINDTTVSFLDFAGSGVVHVTGGFAALISAKILGPRHLKKAVHDGSPGALILSANVPYHNLPMAVLGSFILLFGFLSFNGASVASISSAGNGPTYAMAVVNTIISGSAAGITSLLICRSRFMGGKWSLMKTVNASLAGMVAICSGCAFVAPWGAFLIGSIAGLLYNLWSYCISRAGIDDPLDSVAVHAGGGTWGLIGTAFFHRSLGIFTQFNVASLILLLWQLVGCVAIAGWALVTTGIAFLALQRLGLRSEDNDELRGLDYPTCGEVAYPFNANFDGWLIESDSQGSFISVDSPNTGYLRSSKVPAEKNPFFRPVTKQEESFAASSTETNGDARTVNGIGDENQHLLGDMKNESPV